MDSELCHVGFPTALPSDLRQRYNQLPSPQCTNITYINTFVHKMLLFLINANDSDIRNIICHLTDAVSNLNRLHVSTTIL